MQADPTHFYASTLKTRGWNEKLIAQLLGEPDQWGSNPHYRSGPPTRLFDRERVTQAEAADIFQSHLTARVSRVKAAPKAVQTKTQGLTERLTQIKISIPVYSETHLLRLAAKHYNQRQHARAEERDDGDFEPISELSPFSVACSFRDRICVNYLRHGLTHYDNLLAKIAGKTGRSRGHELLFRRIINEIGLIYPQLRTEADRQYRERFA